MSHVPGQRVAARAGNIPFMAIDTGPELDRPRDPQPAPPVEAAPPRAATVMMAAFALAGVSVAVVLPLTALAARYVVGTASAAALVLMVAIVTSILVFVACWSGQNCAVRVLHAWITRARPR
jgi:hypothetical protein